MKRSFVGSAVLGLGIGFPVTILCMILVGGFRPVVMEFLVWMLASACYGLLSGLMFNEKNELPLPAVMGIHCLGCLAITAAAVSVCGYVDSLVSFLAGILPVFVIVYVLVFAFCFWMIKREEKRINEALNKK